MSTLLFKAAEFDLSVFVNAVQYSALKVTLSLSRRRMSRFAILEKHAQYIRKFVDHFRSGKMTKIN